MIEKEKFEELFKKLNINYGKSFNKETIQMYYSYIKEINNLDKIVDYIIMNDLYFPPVARFYEVDRIIAKEEKEKKELEEFRKAKERLERRNKI